MTKSGQFITSHKDLELYKQVLKYTQLPLRCKIIFCFGRRGNIHCKK